MACVPAEGGQMPLTRRLQRRLYYNIFAKVYNEVNLGQLDIFEEDTVVTPQLLMEKE